MLGNKSFFFALLRQDIPHLKGTHCFLHRHALASKTLPLKLKNFLDALSHHLFKSLRQDHSKQHLVLFFPTEVRWLSRGRALTRFFELRNKVKVFLKKCDYDHAKEMESEEFNQILAYLSDIFSLMNNLSVSIQGENTNKLKFCEVLNAFKEKLLLW